MTVYVDTPRWNREHGPSGHMVGDSIDELHEMARTLDLPSTCFLPFAVLPHYQLPASERDAAIARGAIPLEPTAFTRMIEKIGRVLRCSRIGEATVHRISDPVRPSRKRRRRKKKAKREEAQLALV